MAPVAFVPEQQLSSIEKVKASVENHVQATTKATAKAKASAKAQAESALAIAKSFQGRAAVLARDPQFRTITISTGTGAIVLGSVGGAFGTASGIVIGTVAGAVPALFTFGLSLPIGAAVGGATGLCVGTASGVGFGAIGGSAAGYGGYKYRIQIKHGLGTIQKKALEAHSQTKVASGLAMEKTKAKVVLLVDDVKQKGITAGKFGKETSLMLAALPSQAMASDKFKVTAASGTAGAAVGGGAGAIVGGTAGAALGLIPALFTFGLSIPAGAMLGGCVGAFSGTATGAAGGSALGYCGYTYKKEIRSSAETVLSTVKNQTENATKKVRSSAAKVSESIKLYSSTGGTA